MLASFRSRLVLSNLLITLLGLLIVVLVFTQILVTRSTEVRKADRAEQARNVALEIERTFRQGGAKSKALYKQQAILASHILNVRIVIISRNPPRLTVDTKSS